MLANMQGEIGMPPYFYNVHALCKIQQLQSVPKMDDILARLRKAGHKAVRTHFTPVGIKTDAPYGAISEAIAWKR
jgi:tRNA (guanine26-N2/guanine27-N2)-dimethyltransferase